MIYKNYDDVLKIMGELTDNYLIDRYKKGILKMFSLNYLYDDLIMLKNM